MNTQEYLRDIQTIWNFQQKKRAKLNIDYLIILLRLISFLVQRIILARTLVHKWFVGGQLSGIYRPPVNPHFVNKQWDKTFSLTGFEIVLVWLSNFFSRALVWSRSITVIVASEILFRKSHNRNSLICICLTLSICFLRRSNEIIQLHGLIYQPIRVSRFGLPHLLRTANVSQEDSHIP